MTDAEPTEETHQITAKEAIWVTSLIEADPETGGVKVTEEKIGDAVENTSNSWTYECSCGDTFDSYDEATDHLETPNTEE